MLDITVKMYANANLGFTVETLARETLAQVHLRYCSRYYRDTYVRKHIV